MIDNKLQFYQTRAGYDAQEQAGNIPNDALVFVKETHEIITHGEEDFGNSDKYGDIAYLGDQAGTAVTPEFNPQDDTVWTKDQVLSDDKKDTVQANILNKVAGDGMGKVVLKKNMVSGVNTLTQDMFYKTEGNTRVPNTNTIFVIKYDYTLAEDVTIPENCILEFDGGSVTGEHTITGQNTGINAGLAKIFNTDVTLAGTWNVAEAYPEWFGAKGDDITDCSNAINKALSIKAPKMVLNDGTYCISETIISLYSNIQINKSATIKAIADMDYMVIIDRSHFVHHIFELDYNAEISGGGTIDGNSHAKVGVCPKWVMVFNINNLIIKGTIFYGYVAQFIDFENGQSSVYNSGYTLMHNVHFLNTSEKLENTWFISIDIVNESTNATRLHHNFSLIGSQSDANAYVESFKTNNPLETNEKYNIRTLNGSVGIYANRSDSIYEDVFLIDYIIGAGCYSDSYFKNVHPWILHSQNYPNSISFDCYNAGHIVNCEADTMQYLVNVRDSYAKVDIYGGSIYYNGEVVSSELYSEYPQIIANLNDTKYNIFYISSIRKANDVGVFVGDYIIETQRLSRISLNYKNCGNKTNKPSTPNLSNGYPYYNEDMDTIEWWFNGNWRRAEGENALYSYYNTVGNNHLYKILDIPQNYRAVAAKIRFCYAGPNYDEITIDAAYYGSNSVRVETDGDLTRFEVYIKDNSVYLLCKANSAIFVLSETKPIFIGSGGVTSDYTKVTDGICSHIGTFANKPTQYFIKDGFRYFCTDKQTAEGATDGIEIIYKGNNVWVDALGRVVS